MKILLSFKEDSFGAFVGCVMDGDFGIQSIVKECLQKHYITLDSHNEIVEVHECNGDYYFRLSENLITSVMVVVEKNRIDENKRYWGKIKR